MEDDTDPCAACGRADVMDVEDTGQVSAHWRSPGSPVIVAWTCSAECGDALEARRSDDGTLEP